MLLCPVLCHPLKLGMKIAGAKVAVAGGHLDGRMAEDSAQVIQVASILDEPTCECVAQVVPSEVSHARPFARGDEAIFHIHKSPSVDLCEQIGSIRPLWLTE